MTERDKDKHTAWCGSAMSGSSLGSVLT